MTSFRSAVRSADVAHFVALVLLSAPFLAALASPLTPCPLTRLRLAPPTATAATLSASPASQETNQEGSSSPGSAVAAAACTTTDHHSSANAAGAAGAADGARAGLAAAGAAAGGDGYGRAALAGGAWGRLVREWRWARVQYLWDVLLERHPIVCVSLPTWTSHPLSKRTFGTCCWNDTPLCMPVRHFALPARREHTIESSFKYIMLLMTMCTTLVFLGGFLFHTFRRHKSLGEDMWDAWSALVSSSSHLKVRWGAVERSRRPQEPFGEALWDAWGNVCSSRQHLRESTQEGRVIGIMLTLGGLFFYSLLTSTMTAQFKVRLLSRALNPKLNPSTTSTPSSMAGDVVASSSPFFSHLPILKPLFLAVAHTNLLRSAPAHALVSSQLTQSPVSTLSLPPSPSPSLSHPHHRPLSPTLTIALSLPPSPSPSLSHPHHRPLSPTLTITLSLPPSPSPSLSHPHHRPLSPTLTIALSLPPSPSPSLSHPHHRPLSPTLTIALSLPPSPSPSLSHLRHRPPALLIALVVAAHLLLPSRYSPHPAPPPCEQLRMEWLREALILSALELTSTSPFTARPALTPPPPCEQLRMEWLREGAHSQVRRDLCFPWSATSTTDPSPLHPPLPSAPAPPLCTSPLPSAPRPFPLHPPLPSAPRPFPLHPPLPSAPRPSPLHLAPSLCTSPLPSAPRPFPLHLAPSLCTSPLPSAPRPFRALLTPHLAPVMERDHIVIGGINNRLATLLSPHLLTLILSLVLPHQVMERDHIVIGGINNRLATLLRQLSKSQHFAVQDGSAVTRKRTVLLLTELPRKETEKIVSPYLKDCHHINLFIRSGPLSSTASFKKVAADRARSVILLAPKDD
ncbi:unnamed protein product, partial [Closterium sp. NIES-65]